MTYMPETESVVVVMGLKCWNGTERGWVLKVVCVAGGKRRGIAIAMLMMKQVGRWRKQSMKDDNGGVVKGGG